MDRGWLRAQQNYNICHVLAQTLNTPRILGTPCTPSIIKSKPPSTIPTLVVLKDPLRDATPTPMDCRTKPGYPFLYPKIFCGGFAKCPSIMDSDNAPTSPYWTEGVDPAPRVPVLGNFGF